MMAFSHILTGTAAWALTTQYSDYSMTVASIGAAMIGSLLPDIDHPKSWIGKRLLPISLPLSAIFGHRGLTHSLIAVVAIGLLMSWHGGIANAVIGAASVGYLTHLAGDFITNSGVPLLWPWKKKFALPMASTGGLSEFAIVALVSLTAGALYADTFISAIKAPFPQ